MSYIPSQSTVTSKPLALSSAAPDGARTYFYDATNFKYRPYQSTAEVLAYLDTSSKRTGHFSIIVNTGGTLVNGVITGGTNDEYWFKDGVADNNLVVKTEANLSNTELTNVINNLNEGVLSKRGVDYDAYGDSITIAQTAGSTITHNFTSDEKYVNQIASSLGLTTVVNHAISGSLVADQADYIFQKVVNDISLSTVLLGTNDVAFYASSPKLNVYKNSLFGVLPWLAIPDVDKTKYSGTGVTKTGTWTTSPQYSGIGLKSTTNGSTVTFTARGTSFLLCYSLFSSQNSTNAGVFTITVDGTLHDTITVLSAENLITQYSRTYVPQGIIIEGLSNDRHTIVVTVTSPTNSNNEVHVHYITKLKNNRYASGPEVYLGTTMPKKVAGSGTSEISPTWTSNFVDAQIEVASKLAGLGLNICIANTNEAIELTDDMSDDGTHPNVIGQSKLAQAFIGAINGVAKASVKQLARYAASDTQGGSGTSPFSNFDSNTISTTKKIIADAEPYLVLQATSNGTGWIDGYNTKLSASNEVISLNGGNSNAIFRNPLGLQIFAGNVLAGAAVPLLLTVSKDGRITTTSENYNVANPTTDGSGWIQGFNCILTGNVPVSNVGGQSNCIWYKGNGSVEIYAGNVSSGTAVPKAMTITSDGSITSNGDSYKVSQPTTNGSGWLQGYNISLVGNIPTNLFGGNANGIWYKSNGSVEIYAGNQLSGVAVTKVLSINADGTVVGGPKAAASADTTTAATSPDATDLASALTLVNELKIKVNSLVTEKNDLKAKLRTANLLA